MLASGAIALALIKRYYAGGLAAALLLGVAAALVAYFAWHGRLADPVGDSDRAAVPGWQWWAVGLLTPVIAACLFLNMFLPAEGLDLHHDGEIITSALDLLDGGVPFRTFLWPHGASDSGVGAVLIGWTGNKGLGMILAWRAITVAVGFIGLFLMTLGLTSQPLASLLFAATIASLSKAPMYVMTRNVFPILTLILLGVRYSRAMLFGAGLMLGIGHLWRIETAVFGLATVLIFILIERYYVHGYALDGRFWRHLLNPRAVAPPRETAWRCCWARRAACCSRG